MSLCFVSSPKDIWSWNFMDGMTIVTKPQWTWKKVICYVSYLINTEMEMLSFCWHFHQWLHQKMSLKKLIKYIQNNINSAWIYRCCQLHIAEELQNTATIIMIRMIQWIFLMMTCHNIVAINDKNQIPSTGTILFIRLANERQCYIIIVTVSLIGWAHILNDPCINNNKRYYITNFVSLKN